MTNEQPAIDPTETPLVSWKEIANYLNRDVRTVKRWEHNERLPVHRHFHCMRSTVYAYRSELDAWRLARRPAADQTARHIVDSPHARAWSIAIGLVLALLAGGDGRILRPIGTAAQGNDIVARRVWAGSDVDFMGKVSPDGRYISFVDWETGDLAIRELRSGRKRRLTARDPGASRRRLHSSRGSLPTGARWRTHGPM